jgi:8-oxo-dGTP diphosphatase
LITDDEGRLLLVRRAYPPFDWVLPGGNAEDGESPTDTVMREVREELGVELDCECLAGVYYEPDHVAGEFLHFVFRCRMRARPLAMDPREVATYEYFAPHALPEEIDSSTRMRILDAIAAGSTPLPMTLPARVRQVAKRSHNAPPVD